MTNGVDDSPENPWSQSPREALQRITDIARRVLKAPMAILSSFEADHPLVLCQSGADPRASPLASDLLIPMRQTPVVLVDTRDRRGVEGVDLSGTAAAYLGVPIRLSNGRMIGTLSVLDHVPHAWSEEDVDVIGELAACLASQIELNIENTRRERAEAAVRSAHVAKETVLVNVSHELRTPLQAILGYSDFLTRELRPPMIAAHARNIKIATNAILSIVNQLLDQAEADAGPHAERVVDLRKMGETCLAMVGPQAIEKSLETKLVIDPGVARYVAVDGQKVQQALLNLLNNAVKFTDKGGVMLRIETAPGGLRFSVVDSGIGVRLDERDRLFERFFRIEPEGEARDGTGLGLSITKSLVERMGGTIGLCANLGSGATFWFEIPALVRAEAPDPQGDVATQAPTAPASLLSARILLADDLDLNRKLIADMLSIEGHLVDCVADGEAAVKAVTACSYDLILMDMIMPGMDGLAATRAIRALPAPVCDVPIVALTANSFREQLDSCLKAGMNATLTKPMSMDALTRAVCAWTRDRNRAA